MLRARMARGGRLEIIDEQGNPVGRVTRPTDLRLFGPDRGTVYLERSLPRPETREPEHSPQAA